MQKLKGMKKMFLNVIYKESYEHINERIKISLLTLRRKSTLCASVNLMYRMSIQQTMMEKKQHSRAHDRIE